MKRLRLFVAIFAIIAFPVGLFADHDKVKNTVDKQVKVKVEDKAKDKKEKSVPAPPTLLLLGAAAGVAGLHTLRERRRWRALRDTPAQK